MESGPSGAGGVPSSGSSSVGEGLLQGGDLNDEYFSEQIFNQLEGMVSARTGSRYRVRMPAFIEDARSQHVPVPVQQQAVSHLHGW